jgi:GDP-L-fucose synthase
MAPIVQNPDRVFVAGHKGLVGSAIVRNAPKNLTIVTASRNTLDLKDQISVRDFLVSEKIDSVILAAAKVGGIGANSSYQKDFLTENIVIQNSVLLAASSVNTPNLIFLGSACIYPRITPQPIQESALLSGKLEPTNEGYALAKIVGIRLVKAIHDEIGLNYFSLMPTNLYGPNDNFDSKSSHVAAALMRKFHEAKLSNSNVVSVWGTGTPRREFMHADDMASACWALLGRNLGGELINVGTGLDMEIRAYAELMAEVTGYQGRIEFDPSKPDGTPRRVLDISKIESYGWSPKIALRDGLISTYRWYVDALGKGIVRGH